MLGNPKYKRGEKVSFIFRGKTKIGYIYIVDAFGTFEQDEEPSYDIMVKEENCLYKHFRESEVNSFDIYLTKNPNDL